MADPSTAPDPGVETTESEPSSDSWWSKNIAIVIALVALTGTIFASLLSFLAVRHTVDAQQSLDRQDLLEASYQDFLNQISGYEVQFLRFVVLVAALPPAATEDDLPPETKAQLDEINRELTGYSDGIAESVLRLRVVANEGAADAAAGIWFDNQRVLASLVFGEVVGEGDPLESLCINRRTFIEEARKDLGLSTIANPLQNDALCDPDAQSPFAPVAEEIFGSLNLEEQG